jgi:hypothetical protein
MLTIIFREYRNTAVSGKSFLTVPSSQDLLRYNVHCGKTPQSHPKIITSECNVKVVPDQRDSFGKEEAALTDWLRNVSFSHFTLVDPMFEEIARWSVNWGAGAYHAFQGQLFSILSHDVMPYHKRSSRTSNYGGKGTTG